MIKMANNVETKNIKMQVGHIIYLVMLTTSILFRGLFFENELLFFALLMSGIALLLLWKNKSFAFNCIDVIMLFYTLAYGIAIFDAASPRNALLQFIKQGLYFLAFLLAAKVYTNNRRTLAALSLLGTASLSTVVTLLSSIGIVNYNGAVNGYRFSSTMQYPNAYAALMVMAIVLSIYFFVTCGYTKRRAVLFTFIWLLNTQGFFGTGSRTGFLLYVVTMIIFFFVTPEEFRVKVIMNFTFINIVSILSIPFIMSGELIQGLLALFLSCSVIYLLQNTLKLSELSLKRQLLESNKCFIGISVILIGIIIYVVNNNYLSIMNRIFKITQVKNLSERFYFYQDALRIFKDHWLVGAGGGAWNALYRLYQSYLYDTTQIHSSIVQMLVEIGTLGTIAFLIVVCAVLIEMIQVIKQKDYFKTSIGIALMSMFFHSIVDWDFTIPVFCMLFFSLLGLFYAQEGRKNIFYKPLRLAVTSFALAIFVISFSFSIAHLFVDKNAIEIKEGNITVDKLSTYITSFEKARRLDVLNPAYADILGQLKLVKGQVEQNTTLIEDGLEHLNNAIALDPYNYKYYLSLGKSLERVGKYSEAFKMFQKTIEVMPLSYTGYEALLQSYTIYAFITGNDEYFRKTLKVYEGIVVQMAKIHPKYMEFWHGPHLDQAPYVNLFTGISNIMLGNYDVGWEQLEVADKQSDDTKLKEMISDWRIIADTIENEGSLMEKDRLKDPKIGDLVNNYLEKKE